MVRPKVDATTATRQSAQVLYGIGMQIGDQVGPYHVTGQLGHGGMGEVYRASDTRLNRDVALKVLPSFFTHDAARIARFRREAQLLASLNHPSIGAIYGLEEAHGETALVLEMVEGLTLADHIARGPIPLAEALPIAEQIAQALAAAHDQGIVHRDLKPSNIKVRPDGTVKVLDFGLAKALGGPGEAGGAGQAGGSGGNIPGSSGLPALPALTSPTLSSPAQMTRVGVILGTAAYMSPEQAAGRGADRRSDLWSFGVVLLEMLTGRAVFTGETVSHVLAAVLQTKPDLGTLPADTPAPVRRLLQRCLQQDPKRRLDSAHAAWLDLEDARNAPTTPAAVDAPSRHLTPWIVASAVGGALAAGLATWMLVRPAPPPAARPSRFTIAVPSALPFEMSARADARDFAVSPDGRFLVYRSTNGQLAVRQFDRLEAVPLKGVTGAAMPFVSPDSHWIGFVQTDLMLRKVAVDGGAPITLAQLPVWPRGATWVDDATIVLGSNSAETGLLRVPAGGGQPTVLTRPDRTRLEEGHMLPAALPGGRALLFTIGAVEPQNARIAVLDLASGQYTPVLDGGRDAQYVSSGHLVYLSGLTMAAVAFDLERRQVTGTPVRVLDDVAAAPTGALNVAVTSGGTVVLVPGTPEGTASRSLVWVDRQGRETPIPAPVRAYEIARLSPDGTQVAVSIRDEANDIWLWHLARQTLTRLTFDPDIDLSPTWTPDGRRIVFASARSGAYNLYARDVDDASGSDVRITIGPNTQLPESVTPDGQRVIAHELRPETKSDIVAFRLTPVSGADATPPDVLVQTPVDEWNAVVSSDGRFVAYQAEAADVFVRPYPAVSEARWQVSSDGREPAWSRDGRELFYLDGQGRLTVVSITTTGAVFQNGPPTTLTTRGYSRAGSPWRTYDVSNDGQRFLMIKASDQSGTRGEETQTGFVVIQNWFAELARLVPER